MGLFKDLMKAKVHVGVLKMKNVYKGNVKIWSNELSILIILRGSNYYIHNDSLSTTSGNLPSGTTSYFTIGVDGTLYITLISSLRGYAYKLNSDGSLTNLGFPTSTVLDNFVSILFYNGYWYLTNGYNGVTSVKYGTSIVSATTTVSFTASGNLFLKVVNGFLIVLGRGTALSFNYLSSYNTLTHVSTPGAPQDIVWTGSRYIMVTGSSVYSSNNLTGPYTLIATTNAANRCVYGNGKVLLYSIWSAAILPDGSNTVTAIPVFGYMANCEYHEGLKRFMGTDDYGALYILNENNYTWELYKAAVFTSSVSYTRFGIALFK